MLATGHSLDVYFIHRTSPLNYIRVGGGIPPRLWEAEVFDGLCKPVSLYNKSFISSLSIIFREPKITDF